MKHHLEVHTPLSKKTQTAGKQPDSNSILRSQCPQSYSNSTTISGSQMQQHYHHYLCFKRKLLEAMIHLDPLAILQSGIFQQYERTMGPIQDNHSSPPLPTNTISQFDSDTPSFQTKISSYRVSEGVQVTQVERRSRSCQHLSLQQRAIRRLEEQRNTQFVIFASALKSVKPGFSSFSQEERSKQGQCLGEIVPQAEKINRSALNQAIYSLQTQNDLLKQQKIVLQLKLAECLTKLQNDRTVSSQEKEKEGKEKQLQFLLKEKQLQKKLQQARQETETLRELLQQSQQLPAAVNFNPLSQNIFKDNKLASLKEKVAAEGRIRWALSKAWGAELQSHCL